MKNSHVIVLLFLGLYLLSNKVSLFHSALFYSICLHSCCAVFSLLFLFNLRFLFTPYYILLQVNLLWHCFCLSLVAEIFTLPHLLWKKCQPPNSWNMWICYLRCQNVKKAFANGIKDFEIRLSWITCWGNHKSPYEREVGE